MDGAGLTLRIGLTGGIGSGKSTVAATLSRLGATVVDADLISRSLTGPGGAALNDVVGAFGKDMIGTDGGLDRQRMRALVFADAQAKRRLEAILHPMIRAETERQAKAAASADVPAIVFDVPLLTESRHWLDQVDKVLVVDCSEATQLERVLRRPGWKPETARAVIASQASRSTRLGHADAVIVNDDSMSLAQLDDEVAALWAKWTQPRQ